MSVAVSRVEAAARRTRRRDNLVTWSARALVLAALLLAWQLSASGASVAGLSDPVAIARAWWRLASSGILLEHAEVTFLEFAIGLLAGTSLGFTLAVLLGFLPVAYRLIEPYLMALYGVPKIVLVPLFVLWFGTGITTRVVMVGTVSFFLVLVTTVAGLRSVRPELAVDIRVLGGGRLAVFRYAALPHALPFVLPALRISVASSMGGAVLAEYLSAGQGLGYLLNQASAYLDNAQVMALVFTLAAMVIACRLALAPLEGWARRFEGVEH